VNRGLSIAAAVIVVMVLAFLTIREALAREYSPGEVYLIPGEKGYTVAKVLVVDPDLVHIRLYKNVFPQRPTHIDLSTLKLGGIDDPDGFGIGHLPLTRSTFSSWHPELLTRTAVAPDELDGYNQWKQSRGGVWGKPK